MIQTVIRRTLMCVLFSQVILFSNQGFSETQVKNEELEARVERLIYQLKDKNPDRKSDAALTLVQLLEDEGSSFLKNSKRIAEQNSEILQILIHALKDRNPYVRGIGASLLLGIGPEAREAVSHLIRALKDSSPKVRKAAVLALAEIDPREMLRSYVYPALKDREVDHLEDVKTQLDMLTARFIPTPFWTCPSEIEHAVEDEDHKVRLAAAWFLANYCSYDDAAVYLILAWNDPNIKVNDFKDSTSGKDGKVDYQKVIPFLTKTLKGKHRFLRYEAAMCLGRSGALAAVPHLMQALKNGSSGFSV